MVKNFLYHSRDHPSCLLCTGSSAGCAHGVGLTTSLEAIIGFVESHSVLPDALATARNAWVPFGRKLE